MKQKPSLSIETFAAILAANGHFPDAAKIRELHAALHTLEALQERVRSTAVTMASEPSHIFTEPKAVNTAGDSR